ncbi:MAG: FtsP/CotA-like multicopper oxidase with cupredoxin domain [Lysobacterales bacterium]
MIRNLQSKIIRLIPVLMLSAVMDAYAQDHSAHRMKLDDSGMVMNQNLDRLPADCTSISRDYEFEVSAGAQFAQDIDGAIFAYDIKEFEVEPCSRVRITLTSVDQVRHQWMLHGLPRYLYPGGMFHLEAAGNSTVSGGFIVPSDSRTYLVHCDITQHMEKGMKAQLKVGGGNGDLWAIPTISSNFRRSSYLSQAPMHWYLVLLLVIPTAVLGFRLMNRR